MRKEISFQLSIKEGDDDLTSYQLAQELREFLKTRTDAGFTVMGEHKDGMKFTVGVGRPRVIREDE